MDTALYAIFGIRHGKEIIVMPDVFFLSMANISFCYVQGNLKGNLVVMYIEASYCNNGSPLPAKQFGLACVVFFTLTQIMHIFLLGYHTVNMQQQ